MQDKILYAKDPPFCYIKMTGTIRYFLSPGFDAFVRSEFICKESQRFTIDLNEVTNIDSTNLGILAAIANYSIKEFDKRSKIVSTNSDINEILKSMGFEKVFKIIKQRQNLPKYFNDTADFEQDIRDQNELILDSHKNLMKMNDKNQQEFLNVIKTIEQSARKSTK